MSRNEEEGGGHDAIGNPGYMAMMPSNSIAAPGQKPLPPAPNPCKGNNDSERVYEEMPGN